jgi:hypothetical protein
MRVAVRTAALLLTVGAKRLDAQRDNVRLSSVQGRVVDRIGSGSLGGAQVQLVPELNAGGARVFGVQAEGDGRYRIDSVTAGTYLATFSHPFLDSLGIEAPVVRVVVRAKGVTRLDLGTPPRDKVIRALCPAGSLGDSTALFLGHVRDARTGMPLPRASVRIRWTELVLGNGEVERLAPSVTAESDAVGWFAVCNLPVGIDLLVQAASQSDSSGQLLQQVSWRSITHRELYVGPVERLTDSTTVALASPSLSARVGPVRLRGTVTKTSGAPIAGAQLHVSGAVAEALSNERGAFVLDRLPAGSQTLEVRALGYVPERQSIDVMLEGESQNIGVTMTSTKQFLDTVRVTAFSAFSRDANGFERRRKATMGRFITREDISKRAGMFVSDHLAGILGVSMVPANFGQIATMRGGDGRACNPTVYIDRMRLGLGFSGESVGDSNIDDWARPEDVDGIEVYTHGMEVPAEFYTGSDCGAIVIWTSRFRASSRVRAKKK